MKTIALVQNQKAKGRTLSTFFPRIIREFEDNDEPMVYENEKH